MPKIVNHEERKNQILRKALWVFIKKGYTDTSLADIADSCNISRPTLYQYFNDKSDIFYYALKYTTDLLQQDFLELSKNSDLPVRERMHRLANMVLQTLYRRKDLIAILFDFLISLKKENHDILEPVRRRTIRFHRLLAYLFQQGLRAGEFKDAQPMDIADTLFDFFESYFMHIAIVKDYTPDKAARIITPFIDGL